MRFVDAKPRLPVGTEVPGHGPVTAALHADGDHEVYALATEATPNLFLVRVGAQNRVAPAKWWAAQGADRIVIHQPFRESQLGAGWLDGVAAVDGQWLGATVGTQLDENEIVALALGLVQLASEGIHVSVEVALTPSVLWRRRIGAGTVVTSLLARAPSGETERALVVDVANVVYWVCCGIDLASREARSAIPPLSRWSKGASGKLARLMESCLVDRRKGGAIESLDALRLGLLGCQGVTAEPATTTTDDREVQDARDVRPCGWAKVAGMQQLKALLNEEVIRPLRDPEPFRKYGLTVPNGILLYGPPGCGKTHIARQLAEELGHFFVEIIPSEVGSPYIHQSALRIRDVFDTAEERTPSIVFIDEFEALVPSRADLGGHQQYKSEEVNEFLAHLNSCSDKGVFVVAATNEPEKIDSAVLRTGRLDKLVYVGPPDEEARIEMLRMHLAGRPVDNNLDIQAIGGTIVGYSASDIKFLVDEAARTALAGKTKITNESFDLAIRRVPASVSAEIESRYKRFTTRGI